jgi:hypothetical protein
VQQQIPCSIEIALHYAGGDPRSVPPIMPLFYPRGRVTVRVPSTARYAPKSAGRGKAGKLNFSIEVDGASLATRCRRHCERWADGAPCRKAPPVADFKGRQPIDLPASDWLEISSPPPAVIRMQASELPIGAFSTLPIGLRQVANASSVLDDVAPQTGEVDVTRRTPNHTIDSESACRRQHDEAVSAEKTSEKSGGNP